MCGRFSLGSGFLYINKHVCKQICPVLLRLWPRGIVFCWILVWINFIQCSSLVALFCPGWSLYVVFFNFGLPSFRLEFVIFSFVIHYGQISHWLVSVLGLDRCFQSESLLYLVFSLYSYWSFVFHPSVDVCHVRFALCT